MALFQRTSFCIVTGASRGLGREIARQVSKEWNKTGKGGDIVLLARGMEGLQETKATIAAESPAMSVHLVECDLGDLPSLPAIFSKALDFGDNSKHQHFALFHNAGSIGDLSKPLISHTDTNEIQDHFGLNCTSFVLLTSLFLSRFQNGHRTIINIGSLAATKGFPSFGLYSSSKAARNALMRVLAVENPEIRVLTYNPGPCDTVMFRGIAKDSFSEEISKNFEGLTPLTCEESISKLILLLTEDKFESGCTIDYYDK